jgi:hypothetical protein
MKQKVKHTGPRLTNQNSVPGSWKRLFSSPQRLDQRSSFPRPEIMFSVTMMPSFSLWPKHAMRLQMCDFWQVCTEPMYLIIVYSLWLCFFCKNMDHWKCLEQDQKMAEIQGNDRYRCFSRYYSLLFCRRELHAEHIQQNCDFLMSLKRYVDNGSMEELPVPKDVKC